ncbi:MAG: hypothetical protein ACRD4R_15240 [Candidatus Acidiferrales bacterium]
MSKLLRGITVAGILIAAWAVVSPSISRNVMASPDQGKNLTHLAKPVTKAIPGPCGHRCLVGVVDSYFKAMLERNPRGLALAPNVKYTENGQLVKPGQGIWNTFTGLGTYRVYLADPQTGEAGYYGSYTEFNRLKGVMALRLKVENHEITEVEVVMARQELRPRGGLGDNTAGVMTPILIDEVDPSDFISPAVSLLAPLSKDEQTPRAEMIAAAQKYYQGFAEKSGSMVPFASECSERENGLDTTNDPNGPVVDAAKADFHAFGASCAGELNQGYFAGFEKPREERTLVVDEQQGLVLDLALFDNEGNVKSVDVQGVGTVTVPRNFLRPITFLKPQLFKVESGKIREIEGLSWPVPFGMPSGWN